MRGWNVERNYNYSEGIYRVTSPVDPKFSQGALWDAQNMVYEGDSNNPQTIWGSSRLGATSLADVCSGLFNHDDSTRLIACAEDGEIYKYTTDWVSATGARSTGNSSTDGVRWSGRMFYGATTTANLLVLGNGVDAPVSYEETGGAIALGGSPPATGNFPTPWLGRLWLASGDTLTGSVPDNCENWSTASGAVQFSVMRGFDGDIIGLAAFKNNLFIFKKSSVYRIGPTTTFTNADALIKNVSGVNGCISHNTIQECEIGDRTVLVWASEHGYDALGGSDSFDGFEPVDISRWVKPIYDNRNTSAAGTMWALSNPKRREYFAPFAIGTAANPNIALIGNFARQRKPGRWTTLLRPNLTAGAMFNGLQYVGDTSGNVYRMHDEDQAGWAGASILGRVITKYYIQGAPESMKLYDWAFASISRLVAGNDLITMRLNLLRQGLPTHAGNTGNYTANGTLGWGLGQWGVEPWGGQGTAGQRIRLTSARRGSGLALVVESTGKYLLRGTEVSSKIEPSASIAA